MSVTDLPEELWQLVFEQMTVDAKTWDTYQHRPHIATLRACLHASKMFNRLAEPALYHTIDLRMIGLSNGLKLLSTITKKGRLGLLIRCVRTSEHRMSDVPDTKLASKEALNLIRGVVEKRIEVSSGRAPRSQIAATDYGPRSPTIIVAALLSLCPHLEVLDAHTEICRWALLGKLYTPSSRFRYVAAKLSAGVGLEAAELVNLLGLSSLRSLRVDRGTAITISPAVDIRSNLKCLYLNHACIRAQSLANLLEICMQLSTLWINFYQYSEENSDSLVGEIVRVVQLHGKQLSELTVVANWWHVYGNSWMQIQPFDDTCSMRSLALPAEMFVPNTLTDDDSDYADPTFAFLPFSALLPLSLEELGITYERHADEDCFARNDAMIVALLRSAAHTKLCTVTIRRPQPFKRMDELPDWQQTSMSSIDTIDFPRSYIWNELKRIAPP
ncbi:hypothetical protein B0A48_15907 [Cryoendolithus antarcticus]|uniref:F-box domain-containing protein n=1 Tax=Cryoendolithus antarcticus TaxID=1507870 RepID=A0A1V8SG16_9PEZI|nr:hypothetical protein B0A48_15907 [Cryoendolithus antarcticus]